MADLSHPPPVSANSDCPKQDSSAYTRSGRVTEYKPISPTGEQHILGCEQSHKREATGRENDSAAVSSHSRTRELMKENKSSQVTVCST